MSNFVKFLFRYHSGSLSILEPLKQEFLKFDTCVFEIDDPGNSTNFAARLSRSTKIWLFIPNFQTIGFEVAKNTSKHQISLVKNIPRFAEFSVYELFFASGT